MQVIVKSFPVVYFFATCSEHETKVRIDISGTPARESSGLIGGSITSMNCPVGDRTCTDAWELSISGYHDIRITE